VGTQLLHEGRRTHMTELTFAFRNYQNAPDKNSASQTTPQISIPTLKHCIICRFFPENLTDTLNSFCYTYRIFRHVIILIFDEEYQLRNSAQSPRFLAIWQIYTARVLNTIYP